MSEPPAARTVLLRPRDPIVVRDARPFAADPGARAFTLPWPLPRTLAGALRTHVGNAADPPFAWPAGDRVWRVAVHGPLLAARHSAEAPWAIYVPAPADAVRFTYRDAGAPERPGFLCLRPTHAEIGVRCLWPDDGADLRPLAVDEDVKPDPDAPAFWSLDDAWDWLLTAEHDGWVARTGTERPPRDGLAPVPRETRTHVKLDRATGTGEEGMLFSTEALVFGDRPPTPATADAPGPRPAHPGAPEIALLGRVATDERWRTAPAFLPFGGERRLAAATVDEVAWPPPRLPDSAALVGARGLRLQLVTPAIFDDGWRPRWLGRDGVPPGAGGLGVKLTLVGAAVGRRIPVSGWDLSKPPREAARATLYAVPAGSVFFFTLEGAVTVDVFAQLFERLWLAPVSDQETHRKEGFGLVLPGIWKGDAMATRKADR